MPSEIFKPIKDYEGLYEISNQGRVKGLGNGRSACPLWKKERILSSQLKGHGYLWVKLCQNGRVRGKFIHRLVGQTFISNPDNKPQINHINGVKTDNSVKNLEWCDCRYNVNHFKQKQPKTSKYPGVSWNKLKLRWDSCISINGKRIRLGYFKDELKAGQAYKNKLEEFKRKEL